MDGRFENKATAAEWGKKEKWRKHVFSSLKVSPQMGESTHIQKNFHSQLQSTNEHFNTSIRFKYYMKCSECVWTLEFLVFAANKCQNGACEVAVQKLTSKKRMDSKNSVCHCYYIPQISE